MNTTDFRIANLVRDKVSGEVMRVVELSEDKFYVSLINKDKHPLPKGWQMEPIPLNVEWIEELGLIKNELIEKIFVIDNIFWDEITGVSLRIIVKDDTIRRITSFRRLEHIQYVHQLQNLYYSLTGQELIITL